MVAKKSTGPPPAPTRRSARLASRSPSVERDLAENLEAHEAVTETTETRNETPSKRRPSSRRPASRTSSVEVEVPERNETIVASAGPTDRRDATPLQRRSAARRRLKMLEIQQAVERSTEREPAANVEDTPIVTLTPSSNTQHTVSVVPSDPSPPSPTSAEGSAEQQRGGWFQTLSKYFSSPFARKRPAEEPVDFTPSAKRTRQEETIEIPQATRPSPHLEQGTERAPRPNLTPNSQFTGPPTSISKAPTSLSTITEYVEPSTPSNVSDSVVEPTPSKTPRQQPQNGPLAMPRFTPNSRLAATPTMRRSAQLRAARVAGTGTPNTAFANRTAVPKPRESNADARLAKLERMRALQKELAELAEDEDVKEMQSHRLKRVKIDNLVEIPHNRPGDPSGCFRVPEEDSDDEMEVYENVEERSNLFERNAAAEDVTIREEPQVETVKDKRPIFNFPTVGPVPQGYHVSAEFKEEAGRLFATGLAEFLAV